MGLVHEFVPQTPLRDFLADLRCSSLLSRLLISTSITLSMLDFGSPATCGEITLPSTTLLPAIRPIWDLLSLRWYGSEASEATDRNKDMVYVMKSAVNSKVQAISD